MSAPPSLAERFHEATKYTPARLGRHPGVDPSRQPSPFKEWRAAEPIALPRTDRAVTSPRPGPVDLARLGRILLHTYGVTAVSQLPGMTHFLRASPSAGGLYPSELYVAAHAVVGLPPGIYAYRAREHALQCCWEGDFGAQLARYAFDHPALATARAVLIASAVFERSAWRYHDRAYRRVLLDTGHMLGNAVLVAPSEGLRVVPVADFADDALDGLLLLDAEQEGCLLLGALLEGAEAPARPAGRSATRPDVPAALEGRWIRTLHDATRMSERSEPNAAHTAGAHAAEGQAAEATMSAPGPSAIALDADSVLAPRDVPAAIRRRRSTRQFHPGGSLPLRDVGRILAYAHPRPGSKEPRAEIAPEVLDTWVVAAAVEGLQPGAYRYDRRHHALALVQPSDPRRALYAGCLGQELGRDAAFAVLHVSHLASAVARYGERAYRYVHLEAGLLGERLDLAALALGHGASGIGGFFDDDLARLLGLTPEHAIVYVTVIGVPA